MSLDLEFDDGQLAIAEALGQLCADHCNEEAVKSARQSWALPLMASVK